MSKSDPSRVEQPARELEQKYWEEFSEQPSRRELFGIVQHLEEKVLSTQEEQQAQIDRLEEQVEETAQQAQTLEEVADQMNEGKIYGESGAEFIREVGSVPNPRSKKDARAVKLYFKIVEECRIGTPVTTPDVLEWIPDLKDSAAPGVQVKRVMQRVEEQREDGHYVGNVEVTKHRGMNCIIVGN